MLEDPTLAEFRVKTLSAERIVSASDGEAAYALDKVSHGDFATTDKAFQKMKSIKSTPTTLGFEIDMQCDFWPYELMTYNADKSFNAEYDFGEHSPKGKRFQEACRFKAGEKVLCLMYEGYNAVFPGIVVGPLSEDYLRELYERDEDMQIGNNSAEDAINDWRDFHWDSVIIRPLVRLNTPWGEMEDTVIVNRVYVFPYKKFEV